MAQRVAAVECEQVSAEAEGRLDGHFQRRVQDGQWEGVRSGRR